jgi:hypothetical protein
MCFVMFDHIFAYFAELQHPQLATPNCRIHSNQAMANSLISTLERLRLALENNDDIDHILDEQRPCKKLKQDPEELKRQLEQKYLTPPTSFSTEWLNRLQQ